MKMPPPIPAVATADAAFVLLQGLYAEGRREPELFDDPEFRSRRDMLFLQFQTAFEAA